MRLPAVVLLSTVLLTGCGSMIPIYKIDHVPTQHVLSIGVLGDAVDPTGNIFCKKNTTSDPTPLDGSEQTKFVQPNPTPELPLCHGWVLRPKVSTTLAQPDRYMDLLIADMQRYFREHPDKPRKVVIFFHGGLNNFQSSHERARDQARQMLEDGYYPIFVNWSSALTVSLLEHLFVVRQGEWHSQIGWLVAGYYLFGDLARGIFRAPAVWWENLHNEYELIQQSRYATSGSPTKGCTTADKWYHEFRTGPRRMDVSEEGYGVTAGQRVRSAVELAATNVLPAAKLAAHVRSAAHAAGVRASIGVGTGWAHTGVVKTLTSPFVNASARVSWIRYLPERMLASAVLDGLGVPAWDNFIRHYHLAWENANATASRQKSPDQRPPEGLGAASMFFRRLQTFQNDQEAAGVPVEINMIGHSMGAFMINEAVKRFPDMKFANIVYMAAACPIREYEEAAWPYLERHPETNWYHLTLHPIADRRESPFLGLPPRGSLLVWIDSFFAKPATAQDRTAGRFENLLRELDATPPGHDPQHPIRPRVHVKTFAAGAPFDEEQPQTHGSFGDAKYRYWMPEFWQPDAKADNGRCEFQPAERSQTVK